MQTIWSAVKRWISGLMGSSGKKGPERTETSGEKGLRNQMESRIETEKQKASQLEAIEKRITALLSDIGTLRDAIGRIHKKLNGTIEKQKQIQKNQKRIAGGLEDTQKGVKRLSKTIIEHEDDLVEIEDLKEQHREAAKTKRRSLTTGAVIGGVIGALISEIPILSILSSLMTKAQSLLSFLA